MTRSLRGAALVAIALVSLPACVAAIDTRHDDDASAAAHDRRLLELEERMGRIEGAIGK